MSYGYANIDSLPLQRAFWGKTFPIKSIGWLNTKFLIQPAAGVYLSTSGHHPLSSLEEAGVWGWPHEILRGAMCSGVSLMRTIKVR